MNIKQLLLHILPKHDKRLFFPVLTRIYMFCPQNCSEHQNKTIFGTKQVNSGKNGGEHKSKQTISCHVLA